MKSTIGIPLVLLCVLGGGSLSLDDHTEGSMSGYHI